MKHICTAILAMTLLWPGNLVLAKESWQKQYSDIIYEQSLSLDYEHSDETPYNEVYGLFDIDGNGIPELFCGPWTDGGKIYTVRDGRAVVIGKSSCLLRCYFIPEENAYLDMPFTLAVDDEHYMAKITMKDGKLAPAIEDITTSEAFFDTKTNTYNTVKDPDAMEIYSNLICDGQYSTNILYKVRGRAVEENEYWEEWSNLTSGAIKLETYDIETKGFRVADIDSKVTKRAVLKQAAASPQEIKLNGVPIDAEIYNIDGQNYCKLRDAAYILRSTKNSFDVVWDEKQNAVMIYTGKSYSGEAGTRTCGTKPAQTAGAEIYVNEKRIHLEGFLIDGSNYFKLRDITELAGASIEHDEALNAVNIISK